MDKPVCELIGQDGNVFTIIALVSRALKGAGMAEEAKEFTQKAFSAESYDDVLALCYQFVEIA